MVLVKNGSVAQDNWVSVTDDEMLPPGKPAIISKARWLRERCSLRRRSEALGLHLTSDDTLDDLVNALDGIALIVLEFPAFTDGRSYSTARLLRERYHFSGELRAVGQILRDQAHFMLRCGFDAFELVPNADIASWVEGLFEIAVHYQPAADARSPASDLRHR